MLLHMFRFFRTSTGIEALRQEIARAVSFEREKNMHVPSAPHRDNLFDPPPSDPRSVSLCAVSPFSLTQAHAACHLRGLSPHHQPTRRSPPAAREAVTSDVRFRLAHTAATLPLCKQTNPCASSRVTDRAPCGPVDRRLTRRCLSPWVSLNTLYSTHET